MFAILSKPGIFQTTEALVYFLKKATSIYDKSWKQTCSETHVLVLTHVPPNSACLNKADITFCEQV